MTSSWKNIYKMCVLHFPTKLKHILLYGAISAILGWISMQSICDDCSLRQFDRIMCMLASMYYRPSILCLVIYFIVRFTIDFRCNPINRYFNDAGLIFSLKPNEIVNRCEKYQRNLFKIYTNAIRLALTDRAQSEEKVCQRFLFFASFPTLFCDVWHSVFHFN